MPETTSIECLCSKIIRRLGHRQLTTFVGCFGLFFCCLLSFLFDGHFFRSGQRAVQNGNPGFPSKGITWIITVFMIFVQTFGFLITVGVWG